MRYILCAMPGPQAEATLAELMAAGLPPAAILIPAPPGAAEWLVLPPPRPMSRTELTLSGIPRGHPSLRDQAAAADIPLIAVRRTAVAQVAALIAALYTTLAVVSCWPWRFPADWLDVPRDGFVNIHPGPLPTLRGPAPLFWAVRLGWAVTRVTLHRMDVGLDSGPILAEAALPLPVSAHGPQLDAAAGRIGAQLLLTVAHDLPAAVAQARRQPPDIPAWPAPTDADFVVPADWSCVRAERFINAAAAYGRPFIYRSADTAITFQRSLGRPRGTDVPDNRLNFRDGVLLVE